MAKYVASKVDAQTVNGIRCPEPGCMSALFDPDIRRAVDSTVYDRYLELRRQDFTHKVDGLMDSSLDVPTLQALYTDARVCPACKVIIQRSQGCNSMYCFCGTQFDYANAARIGGDGFKAALKMSLAYTMTPSESLLFKGDARLYKKALSLAARTDMGVMAAFSVLQRCKAGDTKAIVALQAARNVVVPVPVGLAPTMPPMEFSENVVTKRAAVAEDRMKESRTPRQPKRLTKLQTAAKEEVGTVHIVQPNKNVISARWPSLVKSVVCALWLVWLYGVCTKGAGGLQLVGAVVMVCISVTAVFTPSLYPLLYPLEQ